MELSNGIYVNNEGVLIFDPKDSKIGTWELDTVKYDMDMAIYILQTSFHAKSWI